MSVTMVPIACPKCKKMKEFPETLEFVGNNILGQYIHWCSSCKKKCKFNKWLNYHIPRPRINIWWE